MTQKGNKRSKKSRAPKKKKVSVKTIFLGVGFTTSLSMTVVCTFMMPEHVAVWAGLTGGFGLGLNKLKK